MALGKASLVLPSLVLPPVAATLAAGVEEVGRLGALEPVATPLCVEVLATPVVVVSPRVLPPAAATLVV